MFQTGKFHLYTHRKNPRSSATVPDKQIHVHTHRKNRRRQGPSGMYLQRRNSSDHDVKIADRLGCLGWGVHTGRKNPRRRKIVKISDPHDS